jgi:hypothetical protein
VISSVAASFQGAIIDAHIGNSRCAMAPRND